jgi:F-type H+-transporting ATPase subunit c
MRRLMGGIIGFLGVILTSAGVFAQEHAVAQAVKEPKLGPALAIASGLGIALAAFGGALAQGRTASAALEGIARNPEAASKIQTPMIICLALIESLVIYALVIAFLLQGKI